MKNNKYITPAIQIYYIMCEEGMANTSSYINVVQDENEPTIEDWTTGSTNPYKNFDL